MEQQKARSARVVTIDAWNGPDGWTWNNNFPLCDLEGDDLKRLHTPRRVCALLRERGYLTPESAGRVRVDYSGSDPDFVEIQDKSTGEPWLAVIVEWQ